MKKIVVAVCTFVLAGSTFAVAAPGFAGKKIVSQIVKGPATVTLSGAKVSVPQGQTILLGQRDNGSLVIRGNNLNNIQVNETVLSTNGRSIVSYQPNTNVVYLNKGKSLTVTDASSNVATVAEGGAVSATNATINSNTTKEMKEVAKAEAQAVVEEGIVSQEETLPAFVASTETSSAASEQASQNVEETEKTLSPSAPR